MTRKKLKYTLFERIVLKNIQILLDMLFLPTIERTYVGNNIDKNFIDIVLILYMPAQ